MTPEPNVNYGGLMNLVNERMGSGEMPAGMGATGVPAGMGMTGLPTGMGGLPTGMGMGGLPTGMGGKPGELPHAPAGLPKTSGGTSGGYCSGSDCNQSGGGG